MEYMCYKIIHQSDLAFCTVHRNLFLPQAAFMYLTVPSTLERVSNHAEEKEEVWQACQDDRGGEDPISGTTTPS